MCPRVIPVLLLRGRGLVKTRRFKDPVYLGDPVNIVRIFNEKEVDEIVLFDIAASAESRKPNLRVLEEIASECFAPMAYGGGLADLEQITRILALGYEKVILNTAAFERPSLVQRAADTVGSQSVVVSIDVKHSWTRGHRVFTRAGLQPVEGDVRAHAERMQALGAGELLVNSIDRDGTMSGYDLGTLRAVASEVDIPVVACGGARNLGDCRAAIREAGAAAVAAGSMFVFQGVHRAVLISFPTRREIEQAFC